MKTAHDFKKEFEKLIHNVDRNRPTALVSYDADSCLTVARQYALNILSLCTSMEEVECYKELLKEKLKL